MHLFYVQIDMHVLPWIPLPDVNVLPYKIVAPIIFSLVVSDDSVNDDVMNDIAVGDRSHG